MVRQTPAEIAPSQSTLEAEEQRGSTGTGSTRSLTDSIGERSISRIPFPQASVVEALQCSASPLHLQPRHLQRWALACLAAISSI